MELVELDAVTPQRWSELLAGEQEPWGGVAEHLNWADKDRHVAIVDAEGRLVAHAGAGAYDVEIDHSERFHVVGIGGVFVTAADRGTGLAAAVIRGVLDTAAQMGPDRAMLFCRPQLIALYEKFAFVPIEARVRAEQPGGAMTMPMRAMWRPLRDGAAWPPGPVTVLGLPF